MADEAAWKAKLGRPTAYTDEVAEELLERLRNGELLIEICRDEWIGAVNPNSASRARTASESSPWSRPLR